MIFPHICLGNSLLSLTLYLPDPDHGYSQGQRFDRSGLVGYVQCAGHAFFAPWKPGPHDPADAEDVLGPAEEFGHTAPVGYAEAAPGDPFLKIGVGHLERPDTQAYEFWRPYRIVRPGDWQVTRGADWAEMTQRLTLGDWSLRYVKQISLVPDRTEIVLTHTLENTGTRQLKTDWYCHNFVNIDGVPIGPEYRLTLPFSPDFQARVGRAVTTSGQTLTFSKRLRPTDTQFGQISGFGRGAAQHHIAVENTASGAGVLIFGDRELSELRLFAAAGAVCPEPFLHLDIPAGQTEQWQTRYRFFAKAPPTSEWSLWALPTDPVRFSNGG